MRLIRFLAEDGEARAGVLDDSALGDPSAVVRPLEVASLADLLAEPLRGIREICANPGGTCRKDSAISIAGSNRISTAVSS